MTQGTLISKYSAHIAEDMFQHLCFTRGANSDCNDTICFWIPHCLFFIKFGFGQLWIGARIIALRFKEEFVKFFRFIIMDILHPALEEKAHTPGTVKGYYYDEEYPFLMERVLEIVREIKPELKDQLI